MSGRTERIFERDEIRPGGPIERLGSRSRSLRPALLSSARTRRARRSRVVKGRLEGGRCQASPHSYGLRRPPPPRPSSMPVTSGEPRPCVVCDGAPMRPTLPGRALVAPRVLPRPTSPRKPQEIPMSTNRTANDEARTPERHTEGGINPGVAIIGFLILFRGRRRHHVGRRRQAPARRGEHHRRHRGRRARSR